MSTRVSYEDLTLVGLDEGGGEIMRYQGTPFTGIIETYNNGILVGEEEFANGQRGGEQKAYYENGQLKQEHFIQNNTMVGTFRKWDENGTLISEVHWQNGEIVS